MWEQYLQEEHSRRVYLFPLQWIPSQYMTGEDKRRQRKYCLHCTENPVITDHLMIYWEGSPLG